MDITVTNLRAPRFTTYLGLDQLAPALRNPKKHKIEEIIASIARHGFVDQIIVDERTHRTVAGHGRCEALMEMQARGMPMPDGLLVGDDGEWLIPVQRGWASRDDAEAEAFIIRHNLITEHGGWDDSLLAPMLEDLNVTDPSMFDELAVDAERLDELFRLPDAVTRAATDDPEPTAGPTVDDGEVGPDEATTAPARPTVRCPECGWRFEPGDRGIV